MLVGGALHHVNVRAMRFRMGGAKEKGWGCLQECK